MVTGADAPSKHAALHPTHLHEQMSVTQVVQLLEALHFDKHEEARVMIDPGVQAFLIRATKAAARQDAFLDRGASRVHRVIDTILTLFDLDLGGTTDPDYRGAAGKLGKPLLQLFAVIVGGGLFDLRFDLGDAALDVLLSCPRR